jgi:hypothetical protein
MDDVIKKYLKDHLRIELSCSRGGEVTVSLHLFENDNDKPTLENQIDSAYTYIDDAVERKIKGNDYE